MGASDKYEAVRRKIFDLIGKTFELGARGTGRHLLKRQLSSIKHSEWIPQHMQDFYIQYNGLFFEWATPADNSGRPVCQGRLNLLPLEKAYRDWKGVVYFDFTENKRLQHFKIIDYFADEACVGIFHDEQQDPGLYYYYLGENDGPYPLYLDLDGYLTMLTQTLAYRYWPVVLLTLLPEPDAGQPRRLNRSLATRFQQEMRAWIPNFDYDAFIALYQQVKLPS